MIAFLRGRIAVIEPSMVIIDVNGIGYKVNVTSACAAGLMEDEEVTLYTQMIIREDDIQLYGFASPGEVDVFLLLMGVNGVGPRAALAVLSHLNPQGLGRALALEDIKALTAVPGIGKKIAQRILLELKDKIKDMHVHTPQLPQTVQAAPAQFEEDAAAVLITLGYGAGEARGAVTMACMETKDINDVSELVKLALRYLDQKK